MWIRTHSPVCTLLVYVLVCAAGAPCQKLSGSSPSPLKEDEEPGSELIITELLGIATAFVCDRIRIVPSTIQEPVPLHLLKRVTDTLGAKTDAPSPVG